MSCQNSTSRTSSDGSVALIPGCTVLSIALRPKMTNGWMRNWIAIRRNRSILLPHKLRITQTNSSPRSEATTFGSSKTHRRGTRRFSFASLPQVRLRCRQIPLQQGALGLRHLLSERRTRSDSRRHRDPGETAEAEPNCRSRGAEHALQAGDEEPGRWVIGENTAEYSYDKLMRITQQLNQVFKFTKDDEYGIDPSNRETKHGALEPIVVVANQLLCCSVE